MSFILLFSSAVYTLFCFSPFAPKNKAGTTFKQTVWILISTVKVPRTDLFSSSSFSFVLSSLCSPHSLFSLPSFLSVLYTPKRATANRHVHTANTHRDTYTQHTQQNTHRDTYTLQTQKDTATYTDRCYALHIDDISNFRTFSVAGEVKVSESSLTCLR